MDRKYFFVFGTFLLLVAVFLAANIWPGGKGRFLQEEILSAFALESGQIGEFYEQCMSVLEEDQWRCGTPDGKNADYGPCMASIGSSSESSIDAEEREEPKLLASCRAAAWDDPEWCKALDENSRDYRSCVEIYRLARSYFIERRSVKEEDCLKEGKIDWNEAMEGEGNWEIRDLAQYYSLCMAVNQDDMVWCERLEKDGFAYNYCRNMYLLMHEYLLPLYEGKIDEACSEDAIRSCGSALGGIKKNLTLKNIRRSGLTVALADNDADDCRLLCESASRDDSRACQNMTQNSILAKLCTVPYLNDREIEEAIDYYCGLYENEKDRSDCVVYSYYFSAIIKNNRETIDENISPDLKIDEILRIVEGKHFGHPYDCQVFFDEALPIYCRE